MYTAQQNFAYAGKTYAKGDKVPDKIAKGLSSHLVEALKATKPTKNEDTLEGDN